MRVSPQEAELAAALGDRYALERELGRGGMATVYLARDRKHDRPVALKVLHAEIAESLGAARFEREIRLAARLQHPHILSVYDSGAAAGWLWFTMPFVEGETLRARLERDGPLPVDEALEIVHQAAQALQYAHEHGTIWRGATPGVPADHRSRGGRRRAARRRRARADLPPRGGPGPRDRSARCDRGAAVLRVARLVGDRPGARVAPRRFTVPRGRGAPLSGRRGGSHPLRMSHRAAACCITLSPPHAVAIDLAAGSSRMRRGCPNCITSASGAAAQAALTAACVASL